MWNVRKNVRNYPCGTVCRWMNLRNLLRLSMADMSPLPKTVTVFIKEIDPAPYTARKLITELTEAEPLTAFNAELIGRTVKAVILNTDRSVSLILTNNQIIGKESYNGANYPSTESGQSYTAYG